MALHTGYKMSSLSRPLEPIPPTRPDAYLQRFANNPVLSVKRKLWRMEESEHARNDADAVFREVRQKALQRDGYRCWFCGFASSSHQEVHHRDDDHTNNRLDNLVTVCNIDHLCFHLGLAAMRGAIFLAVVPELTQPEITNLMRVYHGMMNIGNEETRARLRGLYAIFESRSVDVFKRVFEADFSNGHEIAVALSKLDDAAFAMRHKTLDGLRVIPTEAAFRPEQLAGYTGKTHAQYFDRNHWPALLDTLRGVTG